jgi:hypothetical protein
MIPRIIDYKMVVENDPHKLVAIVSHLISEGWQPYGSPMVGACDGQSWFHYQAVVKYV